MSRFLVLAYLFCIGSMGGWVLELLFRRFISSNNPERKWINPGFLTGPYVPLYGSGLCILYLLASLERFLPAEHLALGRAALFLAMAAAMTLIEDLAGIFLLRFAHLRLWDYSSLRGNGNGLICPLFSLIWAAMGAAYYFLLYPATLRALGWLARNLAFSFFIGIICLPVLRMAIIAEPVTDFGTIWINIRDSGNKKCGFIGNISENIVYELNIILSCFSCIMIVDYIICTDLKYYNIRLASQKAVC